MKYLKRFPFFVVARGFGMRVVGGKTGADGRLFAYIVWTVPGGPAEKGGLQQGDKVRIKNSLTNFLGLCHQKLYISIHKLGLGRLTPFLSFSKPDLPLPPMQF